MKINKIFENKFLKSIITLSSGTIIGQIISLLFSPIMTRLYTASEIGIYTIIITAVSMFGGILAGRYDLAIVSEENEENTNALIKLSFILVFISSGLISIGYTVFYYLTSEISMPIMFFFISVLILLILHGANLILTSYNNRLDKYKLISIGNVTQNISREGTMTLFGILNYGTFGITSSQILGRIASTIVQKKYISQKRNIILQVEKKLVVNVAKKYKEQLIYSTPALFVNSFSYSSINIFVNQLFGASQLGYYSISYRILGIPITLVSSNVSKVYFREASLEYQQNGNYRRRFLQTSMFLASIALIMVMGLMLFSPFFFSTVFGPEWSVSGEYVQILAPMYGLRLIVSPLSTGTVISQRQNLDLFMQSSFIISSLIVYIIVSYFNLTIKIYLLNISIIYSIIYIGYYVFLFRMSGRKTAI